MKRPHPSPPPSHDGPEGGPRPAASERRGLLARWRLRRGPTAWSVAIAVLFLLGLVLHAPQLWLGFLLALPLMIAATGLGWRAAAPLVPVGLFLAWLRTRGASNPVLPELAGLAGLLALATLAGNNLFTLWHRAERRARDNERRARLLSESALAMEAARGPAELFQMVPRLLAEILDFSHAEVFVPEADGLRFAAAWRAELTRDFRVPPASVMGRALREGRAQYVADTRQDPAYRGDPAVEPTRSELALPLLVNGRVRAIVNVEHARTNGFGREVRRTLEAFSHIAQEVLARLEALAELEHQRAEQSLIARLTRRLLLVEGAREAAATALAELVPSSELEAGAVTVLRDGRLRSLAVHGSLPDGLRRMLNEGLPFIGLLRESWQQRQPIYVDDALGDPRSGELAQRSGVRAVAIVPISNASGEVQALLLLANLGSPRTWTARDERVLGIVATSLGVVLDRATLDRQLVAMLDGVRGLARAEEPSELYRRAATSSVRLIPGAEAASILVRGTNGFRYQAAVGYDIDALHALGPFSDVDELSWYRDGAEGYRRGTPRIVRGSDVRNLSAASGGDHSTSLADAARIDDIAANLCIPITDSGDVVAVLNVDSFSDEHAFGSSARRLAEAFAQQVGAIVRQAQTLERLQRSVVTDPLTGLGNREGFQRRLEIELGRARRYDHPLSIVMLDLDHFKQVNDRFGHHRGDEALVRVARALVAAGRASDAAFRWGGDEFVLLLPEASYADAHAAAERYARAVATVEVDGIVLGASMGIARYPDDGMDPLALMRRADDLMYHGKQQPRPSATHPGASS